jgi:hypothetical protein
MNKPSLSLLAEIDLAAMDAVNGGFCLLDLFNDLFTFRPVRPVVRVYAPPVFRAPLYGVQVQTVERGYAPRPGCRRGR